MHRAGRLSYLVGSGIAICAVILRVALDPLLGLKLRFVVFYPAVLLSAWVGGPVSGVLTTFLLAVATTYFWLPPTHSFAISEEGDVIALFVFMGVGAVINGLTVAVRRAREQARMHLSALERETDDRRRAQDNADRLRAAAEALRRSEERYRLLFERSPSAVYRCDRSGQMLDCNDAFVTLFGYRSRDEVLSMTVDAFYAVAEDHKRLLDSLQRGVVLSNVELRLVKKNGEAMCGLLSIRETEDADLEGVFVDISVRKRAEEVERRAAELQAISQLAAAAAHEINNPLSVIVGNLELFAKEGLNKSCQ